MLKAYLITVIVCLAIFAVGAAFAASFLIYLDWPAFLFAPLLAFILCFSSFKPGDVIKAYRNAFSKSVPAEPELKKAIAYFDFFKNALIATAVLCNIIGIVAMMTRLVDRAVVGQGMATCLLSAGYVTIVLILIVFPMRAILKRRLEEGK